MKGFAIGAVAEWGASSTTGAKRTLDFEDEGAASERRQNRMTVSLAFADEET
jgi:hypothetical protein